MRILAEMMAQVALTSRVEKVGLATNGGACHRELVAGARYEPVQMKLQPLNRYLAGLRRAA